MNEPIRIAVASGKGGTGKTTLATNLAWVAARQGVTVAYLDCDVEEPNGHIFLNPVVEERREVYQRVPKVDAEKCIHCGACAQLCQYNSIAVIGEKVLLFPELCHGCGGCAEVCPVGAIEEVDRVVGYVETGAAEEVAFAHGVLQIGEVMTVNVIRSVRATFPDATFQIFDAPPGTSCPVIATLRDTNYILLVTEPTPFGLHDLKLAVAMVRALEIPFGVVINRSDMGDDSVDAFCTAEGIPVLLRLPHDRRVAQAYSQGEMMVEAIPEYVEQYEGLWNHVLEVVQTTSTAAAGMGEGA